MLSQTREYNGVLQSFLRSVNRKDIPLINPPNSWGLHKRKPEQLSIAKEYNIKIPDTVITNQPDIARSFISDNETILFKPVTGGGQAKQIQNLEEVESNLPKLTKSPVQFQEFVHGTDIRVFILDGQIIGAVEIETNSADYRGNERQITAIKPDETQVQPVIDMLENEYDTVFAGIDFVRRPDGSLVYLESNPSAMFTGFEQNADIEISNQIADWIQNQT